MCVVFTSILVRNQGGMRDFLHRRYAGTNDGMRQQRGESNTALARNERAATRSIQNQKH